MNDSTNLELVTPHYDLSNCDREPIHLLGSIQNHGVLMAFSLDWMVVYVSENITDILGRSAQELIGQSAMKVLDEDILNDIRNCLKWLQNDRDVVDRIFHSDIFGRDEYFDVAIHISNRCVVLELEASKKSLNKLSAIPTAKMSLRKLNASNSRKQYLQDAASVIREITGFDRVMVYRFHADDSGEVIGESIAEGIDSFMGLRFPASDIPKQARALYLRSTLRIICDVDSEPVPIFPPRAVDGLQLDLSLSVLRSVSPMHIEYLQNMGIKASMSISIIIEGKLWGLFACHHMQPRHVSLEVRTACELFAELFALDLNAREREAMHDVEKATLALSDKMMTTLQSDQSVFENLLPYLRDLSVLVPSDGIVLSVDGNTEFLGGNLSREDIDLLSKFLNQVTSNEIYYTDELVNVLPEHLTCSDRVAGIMAIPISRSPRDFLIFVRREEPQTVTWAGNPEKPVELGPNGIRLTPRKSFEAWKELRRGSSRPWLYHEVKTAAAVKSLLLEIIIRNIDEKEAMRKKAEQKQDMLIHELNHRVRNILGLVRSIVSRTSENVVSLEEFRDVLSGRVQALALAHEQLTKADWSPAPFKALIKNEVDAYVSRFHDPVRTKGDDILLTPQAYSCLTLVIHELLTNAVKYGALSENHGYIDLQWAFKDNGSLQITWQEWGKTIPDRPTHRGFGSTIIERSVPFELGGIAEIDYAVSGLVARFVIPGKFVMDDRSVSPDKEMAPKEKELGSAKKNHVLLVEDNLIIAMDAENFLNKLGFTKVSVCSNVKQAIESIEINHFDFAVLDINLGSETSIPIAELLSSKTIPFVFATGYTDTRSIPDSLSEIKVIAKPFTLDNFKVINQIMAG